MSWEVEGHDYPAADNPAQKPKDRGYRDETTFLEILEPTPEQAREFVIICSSGMPGGEAVKYFFPQEEDERNLAAILKVWQGSEAVKKATLKFQGKAWQEMTLEEKITWALEKNYAEQAYFLYSHNYVDLGGPQKAKADDCRRSLEAKIAGMAGKMDALSTFWTDLKDGKINVGNVGAARSLPS